MPVPSRSAAAARWFLCSSPRQRAWGAELGAPTPCPPPSALHPLMPCTLGSAATAGGGAGVAAPVRQDICIAWLARPSALPHTATLLALLPPRTPLIPLSPVPLSCMPAPARPSATALFSRWGGQGRQAGAGGCRAAGAAALRTTPPTISLRPAGWWGGASPPPAAPAGSPVPCAAS